MQRQSIIVLITGEDVETWGNLKKVCKAKGWNYNILSRKKLPTEIEGWKIYRTKFQ